MVGYVKINRKITDWEWYKDVNTCKLFLHMLLIANWSDGRSQGLEVPRGSFISSYQNLAAETGLSLQNVRTAVKHLKSTNDLTVNQHGKNSVFTVNNYSLYSNVNNLTKATTIYSVCHSKIYIILSSAQDFPVPSLELFLKCKYKILHKKI